MSVALDTAMYLREQLLDNPLTLTERGILFTLMFRVGGNPFTWVSQESLAEECDIIERNVRRLMAQLSLKGFVEIEKNTKDKRKNLYKPAEFLINYHQIPNRNPTKKYRSKLTSITKDIGQNRPINTGQYYPVINCTNGIQDIEIKEEIRHEISPKDKALNNISLNKKISVQEINIKKPPFVLPIWLEQKVWDEFVEHRASIKKPMTCLAKMKMINKLEKLNKEGEDIKSCLDRSIINGWQDVFKLEKKVETNRKDNGFQSKESRAGVNGMQFHEAPIDRRYN